MRFDILLPILAVPVIGGIVATRIWVKRREHTVIAGRLADLVQSTSLKAAPLTLLKANQWTSAEPIKRFFFNLPGIEIIKSWFVESGLEEHAPTFLAMLVCGLLLPPLIAFAFGLNSLIAFAIGILISVIPLFVIKLKANARRAKFTEQLPDAIDLMVAVLRSGHSVSQAVKAVSQEVPSPCGEEFETVLQRMNLGQPLSQALLISTKRFQSYELDLARRAIAIQSEVGGSLAELLDKTNNTLRERIKLSRQLKVLTAQGRLSARIVGLLPIGLAFVLNFLTPGYLQVLISDKLGQLLLGACIAFEIVGVVILNRMSTMKV